MFGLKGSAGHILFGNDSGLQRNLRGRAQLRQARRASQDVSVAGACGMSLLREQRFLRFDGHIDAELIGRVSKEFSELIEDDTLVENLGVGRPTAHRYLRNPNQQIPELHQLLTDQVAATIRAFYGSHFRVRSIRAYRNVSLPDEATNADVYGNLWHMDPELVSDLRYFIYLSPVVTKDQGALEIMGRSAARRVTRTGFITRHRVVGPAGRYLRDPSNGWPVSGVRGTGVLIDAQRCVHRAGVPAPGEHRDMVQFWITPSSEPMSPTWGTDIVDPAWTGKPYAAGDG